MARHRREPSVRAVIVESSRRLWWTMESFWHIAAPDVCDGMSAVAKADTAFQGASVGPAVINRVLTMRVA